MNIFPIRESVLGLLNKALGEPVQLTLVNRAVRAARGAELGCAAPDVVPQGPRTALAPLCRELVCRHFVGRHLSLRH